MKIEHKLDPLMQIKEKSDNIQTYGCLQVNFCFMLKPIDAVNVEEFTAMVTTMMKAACDVIDQKNKESDEASSTQEPPISPLLQ